MKIAIAALAGASVTILICGVMFAMGGRRGLGWTLIVTSIGIGILPFIVVWEAMR